MRTPSLILLLLILFVCPARAQESHQFLMEAVVVRGETPSRNARVDVYVSVPFNRLTFLSTAEGFTANYEVSVDAHRVDQRNRKLNIAQTRIWEERAVTEYFARTRAEDVHDVATGALDLPPGRYMLEVRLRDRASDAVFREERPIEVRDLSGRLAVSDLVLLHEYSEADRSITPVIGGRVGTDAGGFKLFYEVYSEEREEVTVSQQVRRLSTGSQGFVRALLGIGRDDARDDGDITFQRAEPRRVTPGRNPSVVDIPMDDLQTGEYLVRLELTNEAGAQIAAVERIVSVRWSGLDEHIRDLDEAIAQLRYIAKRSELDYIESAETRSERLARFREFWDKRDPTPETPRNERMEEYYFRVDYANRRFTHLRDGWKTDRGHVMVLFGEPDYVEAPLASATRPYEVWYYYRIGRRFVFLDRGSRGDFELVVPIWDERTRIR